MTSTSTSIKRQCTACGAPALHDRADCWSCGEPLATPGVPSTAAAPIPRPEDYLRPCPDCGELSAIYHSTCPACGTPLGAALPAREQDLPRGWEGEVLPDGTVCLRPGRSTRVVRTLWAWIPVVAAGWVVYHMVTHRHVLNQGLSGTDGVIMQAINAMMMLLTGAFAVGILLWARHGEDEWRAGPGFVEIRRALFRWRWERRYTGERLQVVTRWRRYGRDTCLVVIQDGHSSTLVREGLGGDSVRDLAPFLSRVTGWTLQHPLSIW